VTFAAELEQVEARRTELRAVKREQERKRLDHVCPRCVRDMTVREYSVVTVYRCQRCSFYRQLSEAGRAGP